MRILNLAGRLSLGIGDGAVDVETASRGRFPADGGLNVTVAPRQPYLPISGKCGLSAAMVAVSMVWSPPSVR